MTNGMRVGECMCLHVCMWCELSSPGYCMYQGSGMGGKMQHSGIRKIIESRTAEEILRD